jgi:hypothetical protein
MLLPYRLFSIADPPVILSGRFGRVDRGREPRPSLAQAARERRQRRPLLFNLAVSRTVPGGERAMAVHVGKTNSRAVSRTSLASACGKCDVAGRRPSQARRSRFRHPVSSLSSPERRWRVRDGAGPRAAHGHDRLYDRTGAPRLGARSEIGKNLAATANARVSPTLVPDTDLNVLIAYLKQIASQRGR